MDGGVYDRFRHFRIYLLHCRERSSSKIPRSTFFFFLRLRDVFYCEAHVNLLLFLSTTPVVDVDRLSNVHHVDFLDCK